MSPYNIPDDRWATAVDEIYDLLVAVARGQGRTTYGDLVHDVRSIHLEPDSRAFHAMLGDVSRRSFDDGGPLLSAIVVLKDEQRPGGGFYELARQLGFDVAEDEGAELRFFGEQLAAVHDWWRRR